MSGGVVYMNRPAGTSGNPSLYGRFGVQQTIAANGVVPAGAWYVIGSYLITNAIGSQRSIAAGGYVISDGVNCVVGGTATPIIPIGQR